MRRAERLRVCGRPTGIEQTLQTLRELPHALRSEEHTSELQSPCNLVCRLLLEKKKTSLCPSNTARMERSAPVSMRLASPTVRSLNSGCVPYPPAAAQPLPSPSDR